MNIESFSNSYMKSCAKKRSITSFTVEMLLTQRRKSHQSMLRCALSSLRALRTLHRRTRFLGNHDGNLKNSSRQDALTPIFNALDHPNLHLLKISGETVLDDTFCLNVLSVFDRDSWITPTDTGKINIALYHGSI